MAPRFFNGATARTTASEAAAFEPKARKKGGPNPPFGRRLGRLILPRDGPVLPYLAKHLSREELDELLGELPEDALFLLDLERRDWKLWARPEQLPPAGDWRVWIMLAGRGGGKTRSGAEWVCMKADEHPGCRIGLFGPSASKVRDVMVEDKESGLIAVCGEDITGKPIVHYEPSKRRVSFQNGSRCILYSAEDPDQSRGANLHFAWADEIGEWCGTGSEKLTRRGMDAWSNLDLALRKDKDGIRPQACVTSTPKPNELIRDLVLGPKDASGHRTPRRDTVVVRWNTEANRANLSEDFLRSMQERYAGTRLGRQELNAEILDDTPGALWNANMIEPYRVREHPRLLRVVVSIDPSTADDGGHDMCGIMVEGIAMVQGVSHGFVLADHSLNASPGDWGRRAVTVYDEIRADLIVYEDNESPDKPSTVRDVVETIRGRGIRCEAIHSSRDKRTRADPIAALCEQGRVHHFVDPKDPDHLNLLEDELYSWDPMSRRSPNRLDAYVHGLSYLMIASQEAPAVAPGSLTKTSAWRT